SVGGLGAVGQPLLGLVGVDLDDAGLLGGVVVADLLDEAAVAGKAAVGNNNAVEGGFLGAHTAQTDLDHGKFLQNICVRSRQTPGTIFISYIPPGGSYQKFSGRSL